MSKKLEKGSVYEKLDTNGDGIVSDKEFDMKQKLVLLENEDKKQDQQRYLVDLLLALLNYPIGSSCLDLLLAI